MWVHWGSRGVGRMEEDVGGGGGTPSPPHSSFLGKCYTFPI